MLHDYVEHLFRYLFTKKKYTKYLYLVIKFSAVLIGNVIFSVQTAAIMNKRDTTDSKLFHIN